jgi:hypothetical protein
MIKLKKNHKKSREKNLSQPMLIQLTRHMRHEIRIKRKLDLQKKVLTKKTQVKEKKTF